MPQPNLKKSDDLFAKSSMTFGEHLEELRKALGKSLLWLAIGMVISLLFTDRLVRYIQTPLERALDQYYHEQFVSEWEKKYGEKISPDLASWARKEKRVPVDTFIHPDDLKAVLARLEDPVSAETTDESIKDDLKTEAGTPLPLPTQLDPRRFIPWREFSKIRTTTDALSMTEPFMIYLKAALVAGFVLSSPFIFYHIWEFVAAGLYPHERRYVYFFLPTALGLFLSGAAFAFFVIFEVVLKFLLTFNQSLGIDAAPRLTDYVSLALLMPLGFGIAFQLPLVMFILERLGVVTVDLFLSQWRVAILLIAFAAMILTPSPDVTSMLALFVPLIGLYFLGIALCKWLPRTTAMGNQGFDPR